MWLIFPTPVLIRHLWQLKTVVFLHWCLIHDALLAVLNIIELLNITLKHYDSTYNDFTYNDFTNNENT